MPEATDIKVPVIDCDRPSRFDFAYALVDEIQNDSRMDRPLWLAVEYLGRIASSIYSADSGRAVNALKEVRKAQTGA